MRLYEQADRTGATITYSWVFDGRWSWRKDPALAGWKWVRGKPGAYVTNDRTAAVTIAEMFSLDIVSNGTHATIGAPMSEKKQKHRITDQDYRFIGNDNFGKPRIYYLAKLWFMSDEDLLHETEQKVWLSAYASNIPRSDYHWHVDGCYAEWDRRGKIEQYTVAFEAAKQSAGC